MALLSKPAHRLTLMAMRGSHDRLFAKRGGQLEVNRFKDITHFYGLVLGVFPVIAALIYNHIYHGSCELLDFPKEGSPPHYWQYERTPIRQWFVRNFGVSDVEHHERQLAYYQKIGIVGYWRMVEDRVKHLEGERWDYKGWHYWPVHSQWLDYARMRVERSRYQYEQWSRYAN